VTVEQGRAVPAGGGFGRLAVELRIVALLGLLAQLALVQAWGWTILLVGVERRGELGPLAPLASALALVCLLVHAALGMPSTRWPRAKSGPRPVPLLLLAPPALLLVPWLWLRDRRGRERMIASEEVELAFRTLLDLPRHAGTCFALWMGLAALAVVLTLHQTLALPLGTTLQLLGLWITLSLPLVAVAVSRTRAMLVPEYVAAPRPSGAALPRFRSLRLRLGAPAGLVVIGVVLAPMLAAAAWGEHLLGGPANHAIALVALAGTLGIGSGLGALIPLVRDIDRDLGRATRKVASVIEGRIPEPMPLSTFATRELRDLVAALDRLVGRITDANVTKYVMIERAREVDRLKSQFLANMSHDLRSPLNSVLGFSELLQTGIEGELSADQREMVVAIHRAGKQLLQQIDDILDTAKIEAGRLELHREPTPPATLLSRAIQRARVRVGSAIEFETETSPGLPSAFVDPYRTTQALENLLVFLGEQLERGTLGIRCTSERDENGSGEVVIHITSPRAATSVEQLAHARRGFSRLPGHTGLGLSLPIATSLLELQGGSLRVHHESSSPDQETKRIALRSTESQRIEVAMRFEVRIPALSARRGVRLRMSDALSLAERSNDQETT
jgi:signal transduction histidine kinase